MRAFHVWPPPYLSQDVCGSFDAFRGITPTRTAHHELGREHDASRDLSWRDELSQDRPRHFATHLLDRLTHARQRRIRGQRKRRVVVTDDRDVLWNAKAGPADRGHRADRHRGGGREECVETRARGYESFEGAACVRLGEVPGERER